MVINLYKKHDILRIILSELINMNGYERKKITQKKMKKLYHKKKSYFVCKREKGGKEYYQRLYLSGCRKYAKRETNRKLRNSKVDYDLKGCAYRRKFDYWWTLF